MVYYVVRAEERAYSRVFKNRFNAEQYQEALSEKFIDVIGICEVA